MSSILNNPSDFKYAYSPDLSLIQLRDLELMPNRSEHRKLYGKDIAYIEEAATALGENFRSGAITRSNRPPPSTPTYYNAPFSRKLNNDWHFLAGQYDGHNPMYTYNHGFADPSAQRSGNILGNDGDKFENVLHDRLGVAYEITYEQSEPVRRDGWWQHAGLRSIQQWTNTQNGGKLYHQPVLYTIENLSYLTRQLCEGIRPSSIGTLDPGYAVWTYKEGNIDVGEPNYNFVECEHYGGWEYNSQTHQYEWKWFKTFSRGADQRLQTPTYWYCGPFLQGTQVTLFWVGNLLIDNYWWNGKSGSESEQHEETLLKPLRVWVGRQTVGASGYAYWTSEEIGTMVGGAVQSNIEIPYDASSPIGSSEKTPQAITYSTIVLPEFGDSLWTLIDAPESLIWVD